MTKKDDCLFCKIAHGEMPQAKIVHQTEHATAFEDINPQAPVHVLIIPNTHVENIADTEDPEVFGHVMACAREVARKQGLADFRVVANNGEKAGQSVFHLHLHLLAGRSFQWPPG